MDIVEEILELKKKMNAVILVHNYQRPEIYKIADFIGDSLELSIKSAETEADVIVFCGVSFMAETAKVLSPKKTVLLPDLGAGCSLADMADPKTLARLKESHPDAAVVCYVNTSAEIKAMCDVCCTSMNAVKIVNSLPNKKIIFLPDRNLGNYVASKTGKEMIIWNGFCKIHDDIRKDMLDEMKERFPRSEIIAHPECRTEVLEDADQICGTGGMAAYARKSSASDFIVATECGMTEKLKEDVPEKNFHSFCNICPYMKINTLEIIRDSMVNMRNKIEVPEEIRIKAELSIKRMLEIK